MSKYIKLFDTHTNYTSYINGTQKELPNVSYCQNTEDVHFNPETRLICEYDVTTTSSPTKLFGGTQSSAPALNGFTAMEIDGVLYTNLTTASREYQFSTTGRHVVKFTLSDPTRVGWTDTNITTDTGYGFGGCNNLRRVIIPNGVTTVVTCAFYGCGGLVVVDLPKSITTLEIYSFGECTNMSKSSQTAISAINPQALESQEIL